MMEWILYSLGGVLVILLIVLLLRRRHRRGGSGVSNVNFRKYKSQEIHKRGHYHDIVK